MGNFKQLLVWQQAMDIVEVVYRVTRRFPGDERFGLTSQLCCASVSIPSNIAEGEGRSLDRDAARFFDIARGSLREVDSQVRVAQRLGYLDAPEAEALLVRIDRLGRMLTVLTRYRRR
jgi:four helix bundle protein